MDLTLHVWRQKNRNTPGQMVEYKATNIHPDMSFLEMLDIVNEGLIEKGEEPITFEYDCREGICGACGLVINGNAHGPHLGVTTCQTYMRSFKNGDRIYIEPWRSSGFPVIKDLAVDRSAFDRIIQAGGYVSANTGSAPDGNAIPIAKVDAERSMDAAECIGCGACVAACPNGSAMLFVGAKVSHLAQLPQGDPERKSRVRSMVRTMDEEGFGSCTNHYECEAACPKKISVEFISQMNREYLRATLSGSS